MQIGRIVFIISNKDKIKFKPLKWFIDNLRATSQELYPLVPLTEEWVNSDKGF